MSQSQPEQTKTYITTVVVDAWRNLFRTRDGIVLSFYLRSLTAFGSDLDTPADTEEARSRWMARQTGEVPLTECDLYRLENRVVLGERLVALWMLFWTNVVPAAAVVFWLKLMLFSGSPVRIPSVIGAVIVAVPLFFVAVIAGLLIQSLLAPLYMSIVNRLAVGKTAGR